MPRDRAGGINSCMKEFTIPKNASREERDAIIALAVAHLLRVLAARSAAGPLSPTLGGARGGSDSGRD